MAETAGKNPGAGPPDAGAADRTAPAVTEGAGGRDGKAWPRLLTVPSKDDHVNQGSGATEGGMIADLRLTEEGVATAGTATPQLTEMVAYCAQLADLVGELMGAGRLVAAEFALSDGCCVLARARNGDLLAARGGSAIDAVALKRQLLRVDGAP